MTIEQDMLRWLHKEGLTDAVEVLRYEEDEEVFGCGEGTCQFDEIVVKIYYLDDKGKEDYDWYRGSFSEFIVELTDAPPGPEEGE